MAAGVVAPDLLRRRGAMCALGAALLAFPAGLTVGIAGALHFSNPAEVPRAAAAASIAPSREAWLLSQLKRQQDDAQRLQDDYLLYFGLAQAMQRELGSVRPDGMERVGRVVRAEAERRRLAQAAKFHLRQDAP